MEELTETNRERREELEETPEEKETAIFSAVEADRVGLRMALQKRERYRLRRNDLGQVDLQIQRLEKRIRAQVREMEHDGEKGDAIIEQILKSVDDEIHGRTVEVKSDEEL